MKKRLQMMLITVGLSMGLVFIGAQNAKAATAEKIVFTAFATGGGNEIFIMNPDGTGRTNLTNHPAADQYGSLSKDGTKIVFVSTRNGSLEIYTMNVDGTNVTQVTNNGWELEEPSFSPDGTKIVFVAKEPNSWYNIYTINSNGTNQTKLTTDLSGNLYPTFSPDGTKIAFHSGRTNPFSIYIMNVDGTNQSPLTNSGLVETHPSFSPDGTKIAFVSFVPADAGVYDIYIMNANGTNPIRLMSNPGYDWQPTFSPDGTKIAFQSERDGNWEIYSINVDGTNPTRLTNNSSNDLLPSWGMVGVDSTPPAITPTVTGTLGSNDWYTTDVQVSWSVTDGESTVSDQTGCDMQTVTVDTNGVTFICQATSAGGTTSQSVTVKRDATAPTISAAATTAPNGAGWYNTNVTVQFTCLDSLSGVPSGACPANQTLNTEGLAVSSVSQTVTDAAGNTSASSNVVTVKIDKTVPTLNPVVAPNPVTLNGAATVTSGASDSLSGLFSQSCDAVDTSTAGSKSVTCYATDNAGNSTSKSVNYTVQSGFNFTGFFSPVDNLPILNNANAGQAIPLKFSLGGYQGLNIFAPGYPASGQVPCDTNTPGDDIEETANPGGSSLTYDATSQRYSYTWKTEKSWKGTCRILVVRLSDGTDHFAKFRFK